MRRTAHAARRDHGFTIVEVVVAALLLALGSLAVLGVVSASTRNTYRAEQSQVVVNQLESELERIKQLPFAQIAMTAAPAGSLNPADPAWRVRGTQFALKTDGTDLKQIVVNGGALEDGGNISGGTVNAAPTNFLNGDVAGTIRRYVVWINDPTCPDSVCPGTQDLKRVIVAATIKSTAAGGARAYQELQTDIVDPNVNPVTDSLPSSPPPSGGSYATFWLTDTSCDKVDRQQLTGDHVTHNTLGTCATGRKTGDTPGAPDLMFTDPPKLDPTLPADAQPLYDYSTDVEPVTGATLDKGLQVRLSGLSGCVFSPTIANGTPGQKIHRWLSPPVPPGSQLLLDGQANLSLWTKTLNAATHPGRICVFLYVRKLNAQGVATDTLMANKNISGATWFPYETDPWPKGTWTEVSLDMDYQYSAAALQPGERLGLAISVEKTGTNPGDGIELMYDHPSFDSRLQVETSSTLPIFN